MSSQPRTHRLLALAVAASLSLPALPLRAQSTVSGLSDLIGVKGRDGESQLEARGYVHQDTMKSDDASYTYWWHSSGKRCIRVVTRDGRYEQIVPATHPDCGQADDSASGGNNGAAVAAGAIALLGIAALAHKSHQRDDRNYNERETADFERGYRDGLYNHSYHNYDNSRHYSDGFSRGVEQRGHESSYRSGYDYRGGYRAHVGVSDLRYRDIDDARRTLERRGFREAGDRRQLGGGNQWFFWNNDTRQCVSVSARDHQVQWVNEVGDHSCR